MEKNPKRSSRKDVLGKICLLTLISTYWAIRKGFSRRITQFYTFFDVSRHFFDGII